MNIKACSHWTVCFICIYFSDSELDCNQFSNDLDIVRQFPFPIMINPSEDIFDHSRVTMDKNNKFVQEIYIYQEQVVPSSVFCLSNLEILNILETPFLNGKFFL